MSALALIDRMLVQYPAMHVLVTTGTVTSARMLARRLPPRAFHQYVPVDRIGWIRRFLGHWQPDLALWLESELWPNLIRSVADGGTPLVLLNGRMSEASFQRWRRVPFLIRPLLGRFSLCLGQDAEQSDRLAALGASRALSVGNLKYAAAPLPAEDAALARLRAAIGQRPAWLASSTHPGEEGLAGRVHQRLAKTRPHLLTVIVPRHPDRGAAIAAELAAQGLGVARRSLGEDPAKAQIYLADTLGELGLFYRLAPIVFIGKSLLHEGGHNPLEPAQLDCAILAGPHMENFAAVATGLRAARAIVDVSDEESLARSVDALLQDPARRKALGQAARKVAAAEAGVLDAVLRELRPWLEAAGRASASPGNGPGVGPLNGHDAPLRARS